MICDLRKIDDVVSSNLKDEAMDADARDKERERLRKKKLAEEWSSSSEDEEDIKKLPGTTTETDVIII